MPKLDELFIAVMKDGGSDLHLGAGYPPLARVRGELVAMQAGALEREELEGVLLERLTPPQRSRLQTDLDINFASTLESGTRFRANYFLKSSGLGAVFRFIPSRVPTLAELECPDVCKRLADRLGGLVLVTGPTGSGRSTTLAAMIDHINRTRACHVVTIEDPIEFVHDCIRAQVTQREVGVHAPSIAAALRAARRESADVVLVGALRDTETMRLAVELASSGVLVFGAMHTTGAAATIESIISAFPVDEQAEVRSLLAEGLVGVVGQELVRTADGTARVPVHEILVVSASVRELVREGNTDRLASVMKAGRGHGMQTLDMGLERLLAEARITAEDALDRAADREAFAKRIAQVFA